MDATTNIDTIDDIDAIAYLDAVVDSNAVANMDIIVHIDTAPDTYDDAQPDTYPELCSGVPNFFASVWYIRWFQRISKIQCL